MNANTNQLKKSSYRIHSIDAVRATALLGILIMHCNYGFAAVRSPSTEVCNIFPQWLNSAVDLFVHQVLALKSFMVFIFLFGLSFFFQMDHAEQRGEDFRGRFCVRLFWLFAFGLLHVSFYCDDVLTLFSVLGFLLVLTWKVPVKYIIVVATVCLLQPFWLISLFTGNPTIVQEFLKEHVHITPLFPSSGQSWSDIALNNVSGQYLCRWIYWELPSGRLMATIGMFFLGMLAGKSRLFEQKPAVLLKVACWGLVGCIGLGIATLIAFCIIWNPSELATMIVAKSDCVQGKAFLRYMMFIINELSIFIVAPFLAWLYSLKPLSKLVRPLTAIGRCTLTCYITQGMIMTAFFYSWGAGMWGKLDYTACTLAGIILYSIQMVFCTLWLKKFKYGPLEGIWRYLTRLGYKPKHQAEKAKA